MSLRVASSKQKASPEIDSPKFPKALGTLVCTLGWYKYHKIPVRLRLVDESTP